MNGPFGVIHNEPIADYHANPAISSTQLMDLRPCERYFYMKHVLKVLAREPSKAFDLGNAAHWLILEGRKALEERTVLQPATYPSKATFSPIPPSTPLVGDKPWTYAANYCKDWRAAQVGKVVLAADDFALIDKMAASVEENPDALALLSGGESEVTFRVQHPAFAVQARADHWHKETGMHGDGRPVCVDLKTCDSIESFRREYFNFRYYYRAAFYREVIADALGAVERPAFVFVALEKSPPYRCEVFEPTLEDLELGRVEVLADLLTLRKCYETNEWPGSKLGVQQIALTNWQREISRGKGEAVFAEVYA